MKTQSKIASLFFGKRIPVDCAKLNYKEQLNYSWDQISRTITNMVLFLIYNTLFGLGWYVIGTELGFNGVVNSIASGGIYTGYGVGHLTLNAIHWLGNKFSKEKTRKDIVDNGNPVPKKSGFGIAFLIITVVPLLIWFIGKIVIMVKVSKYKKQNNGSLETQKQKEFRELELRKTDKNAVQEVAKEIMKGMIDNGKN